MAILIRLFSLFQVQDGVFISSFAAVIGAPVGIASASISLVFFFSYGILKMFFETFGKKKSKHRKVVLLTRPKFNSIGKK